MPALTQLYLAFGQNPSKWAEAIRHSKGTSDEAGKIRVEIALEDGSVKRVTTDQLQQVADNFKKRGSFEVSEALLQLKAKYFTEVNGPVDLSSTRKTKQVAEENFDTFVDAPEPGPLKRSTGGTLPPLQALFKQVFPNDTEKDRIQFERFSLEDQILCVAQGAFTADQLETAIKLFTQMSREQKKDVPKVHAALNELTKSFAAMKTQDS